MPRLTSDGYQTWDQLGGSDTNLAVLARQFSPPPGGLPAGATLRLPNAPPIINASGDVCIFSPIDTAGGIRNGIWAGTPGALVMVAVEGEQAPGMASGVTFTSLSATRVFNDHGGVAFRGLVDHLPGHVWTVLGDPKLNDQGELCFVAGISGPTVTAGIDRGLWIGPPGNLVRGLWDRGWTTSRSPSP